MAALVKVHNMDNKHKMEFKKKRGPTLWTCSPWGYLPEIYFDVDLSAWKARSIWPQGPFKFTHFNHAAPFAYQVCSWAPFDLNLLSLPSTFSQTSRWGHSLTWRGIFRCETISCFRAERQGRFHYHRELWHTPLLSPVSREREKER